MLVLVYLLIAFTIAAVVCPVYTYGSHCTPCGACKNGLCDPVTGECPFGCFDGYVGKTCKKINDTLSTVTAGFVEAGAISNVTVGLIGAGVCVTTLILVAAVILAVRRIIKRRDHIYEQPLAMVSTEEPSYDTLQNQCHQKASD